MVNDKVRLNLVSTYPPTRCGIATYTQYLINTLSKSMEVKQIRIKNPLSRNIFKYLRLAREASVNCDILHIQYEQGLFGLKSDALFFTTLAPIFFSYLKFLKLFNRSHFPKVVVTMHEVGHLPSINIRGFRLFWLLRNIKKILHTEILADFLINSLSRKIIVHTEDAREQLINKGFTASKIEVVPHGSLKIVDADVLDKEKSKQELGLSQKHTLLIFGFVTPRKRYELVLETLKEMDSNIVLLIVGESHPLEPTYKSDVEKMVKRLNLIDRVRFCGFVRDEDLPKFFAATDVAIFPCADITMSGALSILLSYYLPTLAPDTEPLTEIYEKYKCIELFDIADKADLYNKLVEIGSSKEKQQRLREATKKYIEDTCWEKVAGYTADVYLSALGMHYEHPDCQYIDPIQRERIEWLKAHTEGCAMEVGCATGYVTDYVGVELGIDTNKYRIATAVLKHPNCKFMVKDAADLSFIKKKYDTILAPDILEHVPFDTARRILDECLSVGKKVLITLPNASKEDYDPNLVENPEHVWRPTKENINKLLDEKKYEISYTKGNDFVLIEVYG